MNNKNRQILLDGVRAGLPICLGYIPIGLAFGVIAQKAGLREIGEHHTQLYRISMVSQ